MFLVKEMYLQDFFSLTDDRRFVGLAIVAERDANFETGESEEPLNLPAIEQAFCIQKETAGRKAGVWLVSPNEPKYSSHKFVNLGLINSVAPMGSSTEDRVYIVPQSRVKAAYSESIVLRSGHMVYRYFIVVDDESLATAGG